MPARHPDRPAVRPREWATALLGLLLTLPVGLPAWAGSSLAAWRINSAGALELRTAPGVRLRAYFEEGPPGKGPRIWVDLPGAPSRTRSVSASGALREVRIGRPDGDTTRLVLEFVPGTRLDPAQLRLVGEIKDGRPVADSPLHTHPAHERYRFDPLPEGVVLTVCSQGRMLAYCA